MNTTDTPLLTPKPFEKYIDLVKDQELIAALKSTSKELLKVVEDIPARKANYRYAEGKWTLKQLLQHIIDAERVFAFRALWFSRNDGQPLPGFDENNWALHATAEDREWKSLIKEFETVRKSSKQLFRSLSANQLKASGFASDNLLTVSGLGYIAAGHVAHHVSIIRERYLPQL